MKVEQREMIQFETCLSADVGSIVEHCMGENEAIRIR
jgi:hypothetical protein